MPAPPTSAPPHPSNWKQKPRILEALKKTKYTIILPIPLQRGIRPPLEPDVAVRHIQSELTRVHADVTVLAGQWSSHIAFRKNIILTFAGSIPLDRISKYDSILFHPFGSRCRSVPVTGYRNVMLTHIPLNRHDDGSLPTSSELERELARNPVCQGHIILASPRWLLP